MRYSEQTRADANCPAEMHVTRRSVKGIKGGAFFARAQARYNPYMRKNAVALADSGSTREFYNCCIWTALVSVLE